MLITKIVAGLNNDLKLVNLTEQNLEKETVNALHPLHGSFKMLNVLSHPPHHCPIFYVIHNFILKMKSKLILTFF